MKDLLIEYRNGELKSLIVDGEQLIDSESLCSYELAHKAGGEANLKLSHSYWSTGSTKTVTEPSPCPERLWKVLITISGMTRVVDGIVTGCEIELHLKQGSKYLLSEAQGQMHRLLSPRVSGDGYR